MFRKQVSPRVTAIATFLILAIIEGVYWRLLVYREPGKAPAGGGGGGGAPSPQTAQGRRDVLVETAAGNAPGYLDGPGWRARLNGPSGLALDRDGSILIADSRNHRIRRLSLTRLVTTVAGSGAPGGAGGRADGSALGQARLRFPCGVAVDPAGDIFIADTGNHRICRLHNETVSSFSGGEPGKVDGGPTVARFQSPTALTYAEGALWVADPGNGNVRRIDSGGSVTTPAQIPPPVAEALGGVAQKIVASAVAASPRGDDWPELTGFHVSSYTASLAAPGTTSLFADPQTHVILARQPGGPALLVAGRLVQDHLAPGALDGTGMEASFSRPCAVAMSGNRAYVADFENNRIRVLQLPAWLISHTDPPTRRR